MGHTTDFVGHIDINPPLNEHERMCLDAFRKLRRFDRDGDPYEAPGNPPGERSAEIATATYNKVAPGRPGYWCCLALDGFTFNHQLEGMAVGCRRDNEELFSIVAEDARIFPGV